MAYTRSLAPIMVKREARVLDRDQDSPLVRRVEALAGSAPAPYPGEYAVACCV